MPVREIDDHADRRPVSAGPITRELQRVFDDALHGREPRYAEWLDMVERRRPDSRPAPRSLA